MAYQELVARQDEQIKIQKGENHRASYQLLYARDRKQMKINVLGRELLVSFILGGIPCLIAFERSGVIGITDYLMAIDTSHTTVYYFSILALTHFLVSHIGFFSPRYYEKIKILFHSAYPILNDVGTSLACLYRVITGSTLACGLVGITFYPVLGELKSPLCLFILTVPFLWMSVIVNDGYNNAKSKQV